MNISHAENREITIRFWESVTVLDVTCPDAMAEFRLYLQSLMENDRMSMIEGEITNDQLRDLRGRCQILHRILAEMNSASTMLQELRAPNTEIDPEMDPLS